MSNMCQVVGCMRGAIVGALYCSKHICDAGGCLNRQVDGDDLCIEHTTLMTPTELEYRIINEIERLKTRVAELEKNAK